MNDSKRKIGYKGRILVIEDEVITAQHLNMELELMGYEVCDFIISGESVMQKVKEHNPDFIIFDINLSEEKDGIEIAEEILQDRDIPIAFITGYSEDEYYRRAKKLNPVAYMVKPIDIAELRKLLSQLF